MGRRSRGGGRHKKTAVSGLIALACASMVASCGFEEPAILPITPEPLTHIPVPPIAGRTASMDIFQIDPVRHRLYAADLTDTGIDVFDISGWPGRYLKTIRMDAPPNGLALAPDVRKLFTGNEDSTVSVVELEEGSPAVDTIIDSLDMRGAGASDLLDYDSKDHIMVVSNPDDGFVTLIDAPHRSVIKRVSGLQTIDQPRYDPVNDLVYVSAIDANALFVIDPRRGELLRTLTIPVSCIPHGIAINPRTNQGLIGCAYKEEPLTVAWDFTHDRMIRTFDQAGAGDSVIYDATVDHFYFAASSYAPAEMAVFSGSSPITYLTAVPTSHKSHMVAFDAAHRKLYTFDGLHREAGLWSFADPLLQ